MLVGSVYMFAGSAAPEGFLVCDGSAISRSTYSELFEVIGTTYGSGNGSSTFNVPDLSGKVIVGVSSSHTLASTGGEETHVLLDAEIPSHIHVVPSHGHGCSITAKTPVLSHSITQPAFNYERPNNTGMFAASGVTAYSGTSTATATRTTDVAVSDHDAADCTKTGSIDDCVALDTESTGEGDGHENMQPFVVMNYIIYSGV